MPLKMFIVTRLIFALDVSDEIKKEISFCTFYNVQKRANPNVDFHARFKDCKKRIIKK